MQKKISIFAHRGMGLVSAQKYNILPNSLAAFEWSRDLGIDGFETDVCMTRDNEPIIYHPGTINPDPRTETWIANQWHQPHIMHLKDLLNFLTENSNMNCLLEIKENSTILIQKLVNSIGQANLYDQVFLTAPSQQMSIADLEIYGDWLKFARNIDPKIKIHVIDVLPFNILKTAKIFNADIISFGWLNDSLISRIMFRFLFYRLMLRQITKNNSDLKIFGGIARTKEHVQHFINCTDGLIDGIITDDPESTLDYLKSL